MSGIDPGKIWIGAGAVLLLLLVLSEAYIMILDPGNGELSIWQDDRRGASRLKEELEGLGFEVLPLHTSPAQILEEESPERTLFISLGPERTYSLTESASLIKFHSIGGRLLLADDQGRIGRLTDHFGIDIVEGQLYDENFVNDPDHVKVQAEAPFFTGPLLLNRPASLGFTSGLGLIRTTPSAWVDRNGNGLNDNVSSSAGEAQGVRYVSAMTDPDFIAKGTGCAVVFSDPSMFMNAMIDMEDNLEFTKALVLYLLPDGGKIVFDESVHSTPGVVGAFGRTSWVISLATTDVNFKIIIGTMAAVALMASAYLYTQPERPRHFTVLERTGVAEIAEPDLTDADIPEIRKAFLDKVRVSYGMSVEQFSGLDWEGIKGMIRDRDLFHFAMSGKVVGSLDSLIVEVSQWRRE